jgi:hypothetical protein
LSNKKTAAKSFSIFNKDRRPHCVLLNSLKNYNENI